MVPVNQWRPDTICYGWHQRRVVFPHNSRPSELTKEEKLLMPLFTSVADQFGTKLTDYRDLVKCINAKTAGLTFSIHCTEHPKDIEKYELGLLGDTYALKEDVSQMYAILSELFNNFDPQAEERF